MKVNAIDHVNIIGGSASQVGYHSTHCDTDIRDSTIYSYSSSIYDYGC